MGGSVGFTIRLANGEEYRQCRWTNVMPWYINNLHLIREDETHLKALIQTGEELREDYAKPKRERRLNMSSVYGPRMGKLHPIEYGLIVVDCKSHLILDMQGYTTIGRTFVALPTDRGQSSEELDRIKELADAKLLYHVERVPQGDPLPALSGSPIAWENFAFRGAGFITFGIDMKPFSVLTYPETGDGAIRFRDKLLELGFELSLADKRAWTAWIKRMS